MTYQQLNNLTYGPHVVPRTRFGYVYKIAAVVTIEIKCPSDAAPGVLDVLIYTPSVTVVGDLPVVGLGTSLKG